MKKSIVLLVQNIVLLFSISSITFTQAWIPLGSDSICVVVGVGQSNMVGWNFTTTDTARDSRVLAWNDAAAWVIADLQENPFNGNNNFLYHLGKRIAETYDIEVRIIKDAYGGKRIGFWVEDGTSSLYWTTLQHKITSSGINEVDAFLVHHGEANSNSTISAYADSINMLISQARDSVDWSSQTMPIIFGELHGWGYIPLTAYQNFFYDDIEFYVNDTFVTVAKLKNLEADNSNVHFTGESLVIGGRYRYYEAILKLFPCINGSIVYNTSTGKFNFCENGIWVEK
ncbi:sialate O-acetylesterase [Candidatus Neomarinimicrobiota bacterium]